MSTPTPSRSPITAAHYHPAQPTPYPWDIPTHFNIAQAACDRWADGSGRTAIICEDADGSVTSYSYDQLKILSDRFANALRAAGVGRGDRIGIYLSQRIETVITHLAAYKLGAITVPLFYLFGPDAIAYRLDNSGAVALVACSFFMSVMYPTIFALGVEGMDDDERKLGSALLVMTIIGGAVLTAVMGAVSDAADIARAMLVPAVSFVVILLFARMRGAAER